MPYETDPGPFGKDRQQRHAVAVGISIQLLLMMLATITPSAKAATIYVTTTRQQIANRGGCSLQEAISKKQ